MMLGPFLRRELVTSVRQGRAMRDRVVQVLAFLAACAVAWDRFGWDRTTIAGQSRFALTALGLAGLGQVGALAWLVFARVAPAIASERDRKSLDAVLTTRLSAAEIVVGAMAEGLVAAANGLAAVVPVVLIVFLGGVDPRVLLLAGAGVVSTVVAVAAFSVVGSVEAPTRNHALATATSLILAWLSLPYGILMLGPLLRWTMPAWIRLLALWALDSSPFGLVVGMVPVMPRPGSLVEKLLWMIALQAAGVSMLIAWAACRLRPASRAIHDAEGRGVVVRMLRLSRRRLRPRPACGEDPVFWNVISARRGESTASRVWRRVVGALSLGMIAVGTSWFAMPAFAELAERGYRASPEAFTSPEINPLARVLVSKLIIPLGSTAPGQARLEFNSALRQFSALIALFQVLSLASLSVNSIQGERTRDTWLGLIATPLSGREIVRGKVRGVLWRTRGGTWLLIGLWTVALLSGAVHPVGFLAACCCLSLAARFYATHGVGQAVRTGVDRPPGNPALFLVRALMVIVGVTLYVGVPLLLTWASLLSYEDVYAALHGMAFPQFDRTHFEAIGARTVVIAWLAAVAAATAGTAWYTRTLYREFDAVVGRPVPPGSRPEPARLDPPAPSSRVDDSLVAAASHS